MACLTAQSNNGELLRKADAAAREHNGQLYAVFVDLPRTRFGKDQVRTLIDDAILANSLGAQIIWVESSDAVGELMRLARQFQIGRILISRSQPASLFHPFKRTVYSDLLRATGDVRIDVVGFERANSARAKGSILA